MLSSSAMRGGRGIQVARVANDLGAAATVVGHVAQRDDVHPVVARPCRTAAELWCRSRLKGTAGEAGRKRLRKRLRKRPRDRRRRAARWRLRAPDGVLAVDADRIDQHLALADLLLDLADVGPARRIVAVRNDENRLLLVPSLARKRNGLHDRVEHRRAAVRRDASQRPGDQLAVGRPSLQQHGIVAESVDEQFILLVEQVVDEAIERGFRFAYLFARHAAAGVERDAEADRHTVGAEMRHLDAVIVLIDQEVFLAQPWHEPSALIRHARGHVDQLDAAAETEARFRRRRTW